MNYEPSIKESINLVVASLVIGVLSHDLMKAFTVGDALSFLLKALIVIVVSIIIGTIFTAIKPIYKDFIFCILFGFCSRIPQVFIGFFVGLYFS
jgi:hypothetical protein